MFRLRPLPPPYKLSLVTAVILIAVMAAATFSAPYILKSRLVGILQSSGLNNISVGGLKQAGRNIVFQDIRFGKDRFSRISQIRAEINWPGLMTPAPFFSTLMIEDAAFALEIPADLYSLVDIQPQGLLMPPAEAGEIRLNSAALDLATENHAFRFNIKGTLTPAQKDTKKNRHLDAVVWGEQYQLVLDSRWTADIYDDLTWQTSAEIDQMRLKFDRVSISRGSGWFVMEDRKPSDTDPFSKLTGQFQAGLVYIGDDLQLQDVNLVVEGDFKNLKTIITASSAKHPELLLSAEVEYSGPLADSIQVEIVSDDHGMVLEFAQDMKNSLQGLTSLGDSMTSLLLTPGNIERIGKALSGSEHDRVTLKITGSLYDLTGKIVTEKFRDGSRDLQVYSLNPGMPNSSL